MGGRGSGPRRDADHDWEMALLPLQRLTLAEIGRRFGLTRQAVQVALDHQGCTGPLRRGQGFAALAPDERRAVSRKGGKAGHARGRAYRFTSAAAAPAGRKGARVAHQRGTAHRFTAEEASAADKRTGQKGERGDRWTNPMAAASSAMSVMSPSGRGRWNSMGLRPRQLVASWQVSPLRRRAGPCGGYRGPSRTGGKPGVV
jgi:hypothetical protein